MNDWTRRSDIEELIELRNRSRTRAEADKYDKLLYDIKNESPKIMYLRDMLVRAMRHDDRNAMESAQREIVRLKQNERYGKANV